MEIIISDTNVLIDLSDVDLLESCKLLDISFQTVDFVINEITDDAQSQAVQQLVNSGFLKINSFSNTDMLDLFKYCSTIGDVSNLSLTDCAVLLFAKSIGGRLLTGDKALKNKAIQEGVDVSGILYLTDMMVDNKVVEKTKMADYLEKLISINGRLPKSLILERIESYRNY